MLALWIAAFPACDGTTHAWGESVDPSTAIPLAELLARDDPAAHGMVVVSGRIGEVCRSSGCWFVLQDVEDGKVHDLFVDLKPRTDFTIPRSVAGRRVVVRGALVGENPDRKLEAVGLMLE